MVDQLLQPEQMQQLEEIAASSATAALRRRAQLLLRYAAGQQTREIATQVGLSRSRVRYWRRAFRAKGMAIFPTHAQATLHADGAQPALEPTPQAIPFPKPLKHPGIEPDDPMAEAGRKVLLYHFARMLRHEAGTRLGEDIEELHDMRVAVRRMRSAFEVFGDAFKPKAVKGHLKDLRATGRALGRVRDLDVFMEKAQHYLDTLPEADRHGLDPLLHSWEQEREIARAKMMDFLDGDRYQTFKLEFNEFLHTPGAGARPAPKKHPVPYLVLHIAPVLIYTRLASVRAYGPILANAAVEQLHRLRIEFKKLRYTVEFFREVLGPEAKAVVKDLKKLQDHLGDLNDADVACQILDENLRSWEAHQLSLPISERKNPQPVVTYLASKHAERHHLIVSFQEVWTYFERPDFQQNLARAVSML